MDSCNYSVKKNNPAWKNEWFKLVLQKKPLWLKKKNDRSLLFKKKKLYSPFLWMGFNCFKAKEPTRRQLLFTIQFLGVCGTQLINLARTTGWIQFRTIQIWTQGPWIGLSSIKMKHYFKEWTTASGNLKKIYCL